MIDKWRMAHHLVVPFWLSLVVAGTSMVLTYEFTPGAPGRAPRRWPPSSALEPVPDRPTLVMIVHPCCPCTRASLAELARLCEQLPSSATVLVAMVTGGASGDAGDLEREIAAIPRVRLVKDQGGVEARRFGAETSGLVLLYDAGGALLFHGGITPSRGHQGENPGRAAILELLSSPHRAQAEAPVFGCPLFGPSPGHEREASCPQ